MRFKVDIIWNMTLVCPWDCEICCVDAVHVSKRGNQVVLRTQSLKAEETFPLSTGSIYDQASRYRQAQGYELTKTAKIRVVDNLEGVDATLDFSGGDPMSVGENIEIMSYASTKLGRANVTLTATGAGLAKCDPMAIAPIVGELNFTFDGIGKTQTATRPTGYATGNLRKAIEFARLGVRTRAECPLTTLNMDNDTLTKLYLSLHDGGIDKLLVMRLFPVGRGAFRTANTPTAVDYRNALKVLRSLEEKYKTPSIKVQCALKGLEDVAISRNPCDLLHESFGLTANGTLLLSPWAVSVDGQPLSEEWILGNLATTPMKEILNSSRAKDYRTRLDENFGHCKIFTYLHSSKNDHVERLFDTTDPIYS